MYIFLLSRGDHVLNEQRLLNFGVKVMKRFLDSETEAEANKKQVEALFSLQVNLYPVWETKTLLRRTDVFILEVLFPDLCPNI